MAYRRNVFIIVCVMGNLLYAPAPQQIIPEPKSNQELLPVFLKAAQDGCGDVVVKLFKAKPGSVKPGKTESEIDKQWQKHLAHAQERARKFGHVHVAQRIKDEESVIAQRIEQRRAWRMRERARILHALVIKPQFMLDSRPAIMPISA